MPVDIEETCQTLIFQKMQQHEDGSMYYMAVGHQNGQNAVRAAVARMACPMLALTAVKLTQADAAREA